MARSASADPRSPSSLTRLLETEARLESMLADARERADALIRDAASQAKALAAALQAELTEAAALAERKRSADCAERLATLSRENELALGRLRGMESERFAELAHWVANQALDRALAEDGP